MDDYYPLEPIKIQMLRAVQELQECNQFTAKFGLSLSEAQIHNLVQGRFAALRNTGRIEFDQGILKKLIYAFCSSPYILQDNYEETILGLQDSFYYYKNESLDLISDDELIEFMKKVFNGRAQGSLEYLAGTSLEELCRLARDSYDPYDGSSTRGLF